MQHTLVLSILFFSAVSAAGVTVVNNVRSGPTQLTIFDGYNWGGDTLYSGELHLQLF